MNDKSLLIKEYDDNQELFKRIIDRAKFMLDKEIVGQKIEIHSLIGDIKSFDSFSEKIRRKKIEHPFKEIHDLVRFRIVCLFLDDIQKIRNIIKETFEVIKEENFIDGDPQIFEYLGLHFDVKFKDDSAIPEYDDVKDIIFEIQVRTIFQDAWDSVSHHLDYKKEYGIPGHLKRDFYALSGLCYVADTHFKIMREDQIKYLISKNES